MDFERLDKVATIQYKSDYKNASPKHNVSSASRATLNEVVKECISSDKIKNKENAQQKRVDAILEDNRVEDKKSLESEEYSNDEDSDRNFEFDFNKITLFIKNEGKRTHSQDKEMKIFCDQNQVLNNRIESFQGKIGVVHQETQNYRSKWSLKRSLITHCDVLFIFEFYFID